VCFAAACNDATGPDHPPISVARVAVGADSGSVFRTLNITLPDPSAIQVDYWGNGGERLRVIDASPATEHSIFLPALRANTTYWYEVRRQSRGWPQSPIARGVLTTDSLPTDLASVQFTVSGTPSHRLAMLELRGTPFSGYVVVDDEGYVVWFRRGVAESFARRANGHFVFLESRTGLIETRPDLAEVARLPATPEMSMHHDVISTPANTLLFLTTDPFEYQDSTWVGDAVWEWNPETGTSVRRWVARDFLSPDADLVRSQ